MRRLVNIPFLTFIFLLGCAIDENALREELLGEQQKKSSYHGQYTPSRGVSNFWIGRTVEKLVAVRGDPKMILNIAPLSAEPVLEVRYVCYVYLPKSGNTGGCLDTYVVDLNSGKIIRYHCR